MKNLTKYILIHGVICFLFTSTQSAAYIHHKVPNATNNTGTGNETGTSTTSTADKLHCKELQQKLAQCGLSSSVSGDYNSSMSGTRNIDIANEKTASPTSSPNRLGSVKHYTPGWFSSPAHSAHISSPATLTHSL